MTEKGSYLKMLLAVGMTCKNPQMHKERCTCYKNDKCACGTRSFECSLRQSDEHPGLCALHAKVVALPKIIKCNCEKPRLCLMSTEWMSLSRSIFNVCELSDLYPDDLCVADCTGYFCCSGTRSGEDTPYRCGILRVGRCCAEKHNIDTDNVVDSDDGDG